mmetsp:Transcript_5301/g.9728  ORF Transcript_5301/g.9728 Transcript_5301/m.9728 type:complete len:196 (+) Transcript_5301:1032-1619(+)
MSTKNTGIVEVITKMRETIKRQGHNVLRSLGKTFRSMDTFDGNSRIDRNEFASALNLIGINLTKPEQEVVFTYFDRNADGNIDFQEFLVGIRGKPNPRRQALIDKAFLKFDRDGSGWIDSSELSGTFNARLHPKVARGEMTEAQAFAEFMGNFADFNRDGRITREEWNEYFAAVSSSVENDEHFVQLMKLTWRLE